MHVSAPSARMTTLSVQIRRTLEDPPLHIICILAYVSSVLHHGITVLIKICRNTFHKEIMHV